MKKRNGFSLAEMMVLLILISFTMIATMPLMSLKKRTSGVDSESENCIRIEQAASFNYNSGSIAGAPSVYCSDAINNCASETGTDCADAINYALNGIAAEKLAAEKVLRAACDLGGDTACNYFVNTKCATNNQCNVGGATEAQYLDMDYYLKLYTNDSNQGRPKVEVKARNVYGNANVAADANTVCPLTSCNNSLTGCIVRGTCIQPSSAIQSCNGDVNSMCGATKCCQLAYNNNWNRTCKQIKASWSGALDGFYLTTQDSVAAPYQYYCDMTTDGGGWTAVAAGNLEDPALWPPQAIAGQYPTTSLTGNYVYLYDWPNYTEWGGKTVYSQEYGDGTTTSSFTKFNTGAYGSIRCNLIRLMATKELGAPDYQAGRCTTAMVNNWTECAPVNYNGYTLFGTFCNYYAWWGQIDYWRSVIDSPVYLVSPDINDGWMDPGACGNGWVNNACRKGKASWLQRDNLMQKMVLLVR